jgi:hypothetical protein
MAGTAAAQAFLGLAHNDDLAGLVDRQRPQGDGVEEGEDGRIHANAEGQGEHGDERKAGGFAKHAKARGGSTAIGEAMFPVFWRVGRARHLRQGAAFE